MTANVVTFRGRPQPVLEAYADARMGETCPNCAAAPGDWCHRADGQYRRIPCVTRTLPKLASDAGVVNG